MARINTVTGPIQPSELGPCNLHEHVLWSSPGWEYSPEAFQALDRPRVFELIAEKLRDFRSLGGSAIVDLSGIGLGRDARFYSDLSRETGVHIIACTGLWGQPKVWAYFRHRDLDYHESVFVDELTRGIGDTGIRAGIIKVGNSEGIMKHVWGDLEPDGFTPYEELVYRAAARAARRTGAAVTTHGARWAERQAEILLEEGLDPSRIIIGHLDAAYAIDLDRDERLLRQGMRIGYDHIGTESWSNMPYAIGDDRRAELVATMVRRGYARQLVISCDTNGWSVGLSYRKTQQHTYVHLLRSFVPRLQQMGVSDSAIETMLIETPREVLAF